MNSGSPFVLLHRRFTSIQLFQESKVSSVEVEVDVGFLVCNIFA